MLQPCANPECSVQFAVGNVLSGTAGVIALKNAPRSMHGEIADTFFRDADDLPKNDSGRRD